MVFPPSIDYQIGSMQSSPVNALFQQGFYREDCYSLSYTKTKLYNIEKENELIEEERSNSTYIMKVM